jgi:plasmid stabilization system protein ParE
MKVRYSRRATRDIFAIHDYLLDHSAAGAANVPAAILAAIEFIRKHPLASQVATIQGMRAKTIPRYRLKIFYRLVADEVIEIVHVRHTSRKPWSGEQSP